ncbi:MAG: hypothetical protein WC307_06275 [Candidatus Nanoarchaeia archaeon]
MIGAMILHVSGVMLWLLYLSYAFVELCIHGVKKHLAINVIIVLVLGVVLELLGI